MKKAIVVALLGVRVTSVVLIVLGLLFWSGHALGLVPVHMMIGYLFVLSLWTLAVLSARAGAPASLVVLALAWGLVVPAFGIAQMSLLPGAGHWIIRVLHLGVGLAAMGMAQGLAEGAGVVAARRGKRGPSRADLISGTGRATS